MPKLKFIVSTSVTEDATIQSCFWALVLDLVVGDLMEEYPDSVTLISLNGLLHSEDNCAFKEIARQLCMEHHLLFSKMASFDENSQFIIAMLRECGLAHKTIIFVLDEFDMFAQARKATVAVQFAGCDAICNIPSCCRRTLVQNLLICNLSPQDADQLLEKRNITSDTRFKDMLKTFLNANSTVNSLLKF
ncbi:hypothetical protein HID58_024515, partial [Brassica napus]